MAFILISLKCRKFARYIVIRSHLSIYSCFDKVCPTAVQIRTRHTVPIGIMGSNSLALLGWGLRCLGGRKENGWIHVFVLRPSLTPKYFGFQLMKCKTIITHNNFRHCRFHFYAFVRETFSKQLLDLSLYENTDVAVITSWSRLTSSIIIINNYSPKWRWIVVDIYRAAKRRG